MYCYIDIFLFATIIDEKGSFVMGIKGKILILSGICVLKSTSAGVTNKAPIILGFL